MEFIMNESGCRQLSVDMAMDMRRIADLIAAIESQNNTLKAALGDDYDAIAHSVRMMTSEFGNAYHELDTIIADINEYIRRVGQARISLNG